MGIVVPAIVAMVRGAAALMAVVQVETAVMALEAVKSVATVAGVTVQTQPEPGIQAAVVC